MASASPGATEPENTTATGRKEAWGSQRQGAGTVNSVFLNTTHLSEVLVSEGQY